MQNWKKGCIFGHIDTFWKGHDRQIKKNACKNAYLGFIFIPEKYVIRVLFVSPWTSLILPLAIRVAPRVNRGLWMAEVKTQFSTEIALGHLVRTIKKKGSFGEDLSLKKKGVILRGSQSQCKILFSNYINPSFQTNIGYILRGGHLSVKLGRHSVRAWRPFSPINISKKGGH